MPDRDSALRAIKAVAKEHGDDDSTVPVVNTAAPPLSDYGNALRLAQLHGEDLRYVADWKKWVIWNGVRWAIDNTIEVMRRATDVVLDMGDSRHERTVGIDYEKQHAFAFKCQDSGALDSMVKLGRSMLPATPEMFDRHPWLWNCENGTINLLTGEFREPAREDLLMKCSGVRYVGRQQTAAAVGSEPEENSKFQIPDSKAEASADVKQTKDAIAQSQSGPSEVGEGGTSSSRSDTSAPNSPAANDAGGTPAQPQSKVCATTVLGKGSGIHSKETLCDLCDDLPGGPCCHEWEKFLHTIMDDDEEMIQFLQRCVGYSMTATVKERVLLILYGGGANGKSTFIETLHLLFGDYATVTPVDTLLAKKFSSSIPNDIAALKGVRFVSASETEENSKLATAKIKSMTGGGTLVARFMGGEFFKFQSTFKLWLETNHKPRITDSSPAMFDRIRLVPFKVRIPDDKQDKQLKEKLAAELPGILNWALDGVKQWQEIGLAPPAKVLEETLRYQTEQDMLGGFLAERFEERGDISKKDFYDEYKSWCLETGEKPMTMMTLGRRMNDRGFDPAYRINNSVRGWNGIQAKQREGGAPAPAAIRAKSDAAAEDPLFKV